MVSIPRRKHAAIFQTFSLPQVCPTYTSSISPRGVLRRRGISENSVPANFGEFYFHTLR
jgi:hypothetical protein